MLQMVYQYSQNLGRRILIDQQNSQDIRYRNSCEFCIAEMQFLMPHPPNDGRKHSRQDELQKQFVMLSALKQKRQSKIPYQLAWRNKKQNKR